MARTNADKRKAVEVALREFGGLSNVELGKICGVSDVTIMRYRKKEPLQSRSSLTQADQPETRIGADGKERRMPIRKDPIPPMPEYKEEENEQEPEVELYRASHSTFEEYCSDRWNIKKSQAYRLIEAAETMEPLKASPIGDKITRESQARELAKVEPERRAEVLEKVSSGGCRSLAGGGGVAVLVAAKKSGVSAESFFLHSTTLTDLLPERLPVHKKKKADSFGIGSLSRAYENGGEGGNRTRV